jgi:hypothetical protein
MFAARSTNTTTIIDKLHLAALFTSTASKIVNVAVTYQHQQ